MPVVGNHPQNASSNTENTKVLSTVWSSDGAVIPETGTFEAGKTYKVQVSVYTKNDYFFGDPLTVTINGSTAVTDFERPGVGNRTITFEKEYTPGNSIISSYRPFIVLSSMFGSVRADFIRNEDKFSKRAKRSISIFDFSEETEEHHPEIAANDLEEEAISNEMAEQVRDAIAQLKPIQRERLIKYFFEGKSLLQIAAEEGKSYSTVYESYQAALKKLKKIFENTR